MKDFRLKMPMCDDEYERGLVCFGEARRRVVWGGGGGGGGDYFEGGRGGLRGDGLFYQVIVKLLHNPVCPRDGLGLK